MMPTGQLRCDILKVLSFVSILVLLDDAYRPDTWEVALSSGGEFQSLFFWMMPTGYTWTKLRSCGLSRFNPCSSG